MQILVLIKQVPLPKEMKTTKEGFMARTGVRSMMNPYCKHALEEALRFREVVGGTITVLTMGPPSFQQSLSEALSMGADEAYLLTDRNLAGSDTMATARALTNAIKTLEGEFKIIFAGIQTIDGDTGHVGPQVAERLGYNQITYIDQIEAIDKSVRVRRIVEHGYELVTASYPVLVTVTKYANVPRGPRLKCAINAKRYAFEDHMLSISDINLSAEEAGITGSPTIVSKVKNVIIERSACNFIEGTREEKVTRLLEAIQIPMKSEVV